MWLGKERKGWGLGGCGEMGTAFVPARLTSPSVVLGGPQRTLENQILLGPWLLKQAQSSSL